MSSEALRRATAAILLSAGVAGCGFHLAGTRPLPPDLSSVYIDLPTPYRVSKPPLESAVRTRLTRRGARVEGTRGDAAAVLELSDLTEERRVLSVDRFGKAVEYELTTSVRFAFRVGDTLRVPPTMMQVSRDYSFNAEQVLAKEAEEARLQAYIQGELAELLILRLEAVLKEGGFTPPGEAAAPAAGAGATPAP